MRNLRQMFASENRTWMLVCTAFAVISCFMLLVFQRMPFAWYCLGWLCLRAVFGVSQAETVRRRSHILGLLAMSAVFFVFGACWPVLAYT
jgi:hypothetical protein